ncbi:MAG: amidohydrolase family protein [Halolamina sp.]
MLLRNARLVDRGTVRRGDVAVDAERGSVRAVGTVEARRGERVVDCSDRTIVPGLVDAHVHYSLSGDRTVAPTVDASDADLALVEARNARRTLEAGVTGARTMGARCVDVAVRDRIAAGDVAGPRTVASGRSVTVTGGHGHHMGREIDGPADARRAVREEVKAGADFVKFMTTGGVTTPGTDPDAAVMTPAEVEAVVDEAERRGVDTATHAHGAEGVRLAAETGVDTVEHGTFLDDDAIRAMLDNDVTLCPTLSAPHHIVRNLDAATDSDARKTNQVYDRHLESFRRAVDAGIPIAGGTDAGTPFNHHGGNAAEVEFMIENGLEPVAAIRAMTETAAETVGLDGCGTLELGSHADLLVLHGDPTADPTTLNDPGAVLKGGRVVAGEL